MRTGQVEIPGLVPPTHSTSKHISAGIVAFKDTWCFGCAWHGLLHRLAAGREAQKKHKKSESTKAEGVLVLELVQDAALRAVMWSGCKLLACCRLHDGNA